MGHHDSSGAQGGYGSKVAGSHAASAQDYPQEEVRIYGFIEHAAFNGLRAWIESDTPDGRFNLRLADGTTLRWVKKENFDILPNSLLLSLPGVGAAPPPATSAPPPPPP